MSLIGLLMILIMLAGAMVLAGFSNVAILKTCLALSAVLVWVWIADAFGKDIAIYIALAFAAVLAGLGIWANTYDPSEAEHAKRVERAKALRKARRKKGLKW